MAYDGNGEVDAAIDLIDQALAIEPDSQFGLYLKGRIVWCEQGDGDTAVDLFGKVLADPELPEDSRSQVQNDLESALSGASCT
jgi:tetratricopeptide (TPR) repeat protein